VRRKVPADTGGATLADVGEQRAQTQPRSRMRLAGGRPRSVRRVLLLCDGPARGSGVKSPSDLAPLKVGQITRRTEPEERSISELGKQGLSRAAHTVWTPIRRSARSPCAARDNSTRSPSHDRKIESHGGRSPRPDSREEPPADQFLAFEDVEEMVWRTTGSTGSAQSPSLRSGDKWDAHLRSAGRDTFTPTIHTAPAFQRRSE